MSRLCLVHPGMLNNAKYRPSRHECAVRLAPLYHDTCVASLPTQKAACITKRIQPSDMNVAVHHGPTAPVAILKINPHGLKESPFFFTQMPAYRTMTSRVRIKKSLPDAPHPTGLEMHGCSILRIYPLPLLYSQFYPAPRSSPGPVLCLAAR